MENFLSSTFGVDKNQFMNALKLSPGAQGAIHGAISEFLLKELLESQGFETIRIKEKPAGGKNSKKSDARGDFYIREKGNINDEYYVVECKGLKTNSEFRVNKLCSREKAFKYLNSLTFKRKNNQEIYNTGFKMYLKAKKKWEENNKNSIFPEFNWNDKYPGPINSDLSNIWEDENELKYWINSQPQEAFTEESYRKGLGAIKILETHKPSSRTAPITKIKQTAPLVSDFSILAVDLFFRTGKHEFVFMNPQSISHSPSSPEHLYQNYTIDVLVKDKKNTPIITHPWYKDIKECIKNTNVEYRKIDKSQIDNRNND